jgi:LPXTG-motif cell wall-anchored protein
MSRAVGRLALAGAMLWVTAVTTSAQQPTTTTEVKTFEVISVEGNDLVVRLAEGTKQLMVPEGFRFTVDGQQVGVQQLKPGMRGTATITTKTTLHPVTVTEVKNGTVKQVSGSTVTVQTDQGFKMFTEGDLDKRGVKIMRDGQPARLTDLHAGDTLSATIITSKPPRVVTEKEVNATLARASGAAPAAGAPAKAATSGSGSPAPASTAAPPEPRKLPKTASNLPLLGVAGVVSLGLALALAFKRRGIVF